MNYGLIGKNVAHSFSKMIHEHLSNITYECLSLNEASFIHLLETKNFSGINVTMPYKEIALPYLDERSPIVQKTGSLNTIIHKNNRLYGYNTDYHGFMFLLNYYQINVKDKIVAILGTGGTAKTIKTIMETLKCKKVYLVSRDKKKPYISYEKLHSLKNLDILINATPNGMIDHEDLFLVDLDAFINLTWVIDVIYNPLRTSLILEAQKRKIQTATGLLMLVAQACYAQALFFDKKFTTQEIIETYQKLYFSLINIVLIGMPGSGKTTIANALNHFNKINISTDDEIEKLENMTINDIFKNYGEAYFRKKETEIIKKYSVLFNQIIATGGGVVLDAQNIALLKHNGIIILIQRGIDKITLNNQRPLAKNYEELKKLYETRINLYNQYSELVIDNNLSIKKAIQRIEELIYESLSIKRT